MRSSHRISGKDNSLAAGPTQSSAHTCHQCGTAYHKATAKFCSHCGIKKLSHSTVQSSVQPKAALKGNDGNTKGRDHFSAGGGPGLSSPSGKPQGGVSFTSSETDSSTFKLPPAGPSSAQRRNHSSVVASNNVGSGRGGGGGRPTSPSLLQEITPLISQTSRSSLSKEVDRQSSNKGSPISAGRGGSNSNRINFAQKGDVVLPSPHPTPPSSAQRGSRSGSQLASKEVKNSHTIKESKSEARSTIPELPPCEPKNLTPQMLMTENHDELAGWKKGTFIGRGTFGSVYLGLLADGSFYAVKCVELSRDAANTIQPSELMALHREITVMRQLKHPNLCEFKGVWYDSVSNHICMFMQYVGGGSLTSFVKKFKPLPPDVVRTWTKQLLSGLSYLHTKKIIHRDVKGENVLVDTSVDPSSGAQIKLVDFGAARRLTDAVSQSKTVIGTPYWMAPEVVTSGDGGGYSYKADVWSVGCTVAEMLTGSPPWPTRTNAPATILMIATAKNGPTEIPEKEATPGCLDFMKKCFEKDPNKRLSVDQLLQHPWICGQME